MLTVVLTVGFVASVLFIPSSSPTSTDPSWRNRTATPRERRALLEVTSTLPLNTTRSHSPADLSGDVRGCALVAAAVRSSDDGGQTRRSDLGRLLSTAAAVVGGARVLAPPDPRTRMAFPNKLHRHRPSDPRGSLRGDLSLLPYPEEEERERGCPDSAGWWMSR
jgi:hypothetical protein